MSSCQVTVVVLRYFLDSGLYSALEILFHTLLAVILPYLFVLDSLVLHSTERVCGSKAPVIDGQLPRSRLSEIL